MPRALAEAGLANYVLPIGEMAAVIRQVSWEVAGLSAPVAPLRQR
jgi:chemotaxis response regulator CheB